MSSKSPSESPSPRSKRTSTIGSTPAAAAPSSSSSTQPAPPATVTSTPSSSKDSKKAAHDEHAAREAAAAAAAALIPPSSQPPSSHDQTNIYHFHVHAPPFKMMCNSNTMIGVILDFMRDRCLKGVTTCLTSRLAKVREDLNRLNQEENQNERNKTNTIAELTERCQELKKIVKTQQSTDGKEENGRASPTTNGAVGVDSTPLIADERKEDGAAAVVSPKPANKDLKSTAVPGKKPVAGSGAAVGKGKKGASDVLDDSSTPKSPEEEALAQAMTQLDNFQNEHKAKVALLIRERELLQSEERQLVLDLHWTKGMVVGSVVPQPPSPPQSQSASATSLLDGSRPNTVGGTANAGATGATVPSSLAGSATTAVAGTPAAALKARRAASSKSIPVSDPLASGSFQPVQSAPPGSTFLGVDLWSEDRTPLNLRSRPLTSYANIVIKPSAACQLVAVYSSPGEKVEPNKVNEVQNGILQIPIQFMMTPPNINTPTTTTTEQATTATPVTAASFNGI